MNPGDERHGRGLRHHPRRDGRERDPCGWKRAKESRLAIWRPRKGVVASGRVADLAGGDDGFVPVEEEVM